MKIKLTQIPNYKLLTNEEACNYLLDNKIDTLVLLNKEYDLLDVYNIFCDIKGECDFTRSSNNFNFEDYDTVTT